jgi:hypothetical protein
VVPMIVEWFVQMVGDMLVAIAGAILPDMDGGITIPAFAVYGYDFVNRLVPLTEALAFAGLVLGAYAVATIWHAVLFVYHQFWGAS